MSENRLESDGSSPGEEQLFVLIGTYNHEKFISEALNGVLSQHVDIPLRILVRDDASTDRTAQIVREYAVANPEKIFPILHTENQRSLGNGWMQELVGVVMNSVGSSDREKVYLALCEGDDFWTDASKLQFQVDFLRTHPDAAIVHHRFSTSTTHLSGRRYARDLKRHLAKFAPQPLLRPGSDLARGNFILTCTAMARLSGWSEDEALSRPEGVLGDWVTFAALSRGRLVGFIRREMATYRIHSGGVHSNASEVARAAGSRVSADYISSFY